MTPIYVVSAKQIIDHNGNYCGDTQPWLTISAFTCRSHAEMEITKLKEWEYEKEKHIFDIDEIMLY